MQVQKVKPGYKLVKSLFGKNNEIPEDWTVVCVNEIGTVKSGGTPSTQNNDYWKNGNIPWINSGKIKNKQISNFSKLITKKGLEASAAKLFPPNTVVIALTGATTGKVGILTFECSTNQSITGIFPSKKYNSYFLFYMMIFLKKQILRYSIGSAQPHINQRIVEKFFIPLPSITEQQKIASILTNVDSLIESHAKIIESTKKIKTGLMQTLLTKGINHKKFKKVKWLFGKKIEIPIEWEIKKLEQISKIIDSLHITPKYVTDGIPMIRSTEIKYGNLKFEHVLRVIKEVYDKFTQNHKPQRNDIVMSRVGTYFVTSFVNTNELFCMGQNTLVIHPKIDPHFLYYCLNSKFVNRQIELSFDRTAGQKTLSLKNIRNLHVFLPPLIEQKQIASILQKTHSTIDDLESKKSSLEILKKGLMQKLLTGELRVRV